MKKTVKPILGAAVALAMTVTGALADPPTMINSLPYTITKSGDYILSPGAAAQSLFGAWPIAIYASNVTLDLTGQTIDTQYGLLIGNGVTGVGGPVDHVTVKNGTFNGNTPSTGGGAAYAGVQIYGACFVSLLNVDFNGLFSYSADGGSNDSIKNCNFESPLAIWADAKQGDYENLVVAKSSTWSGIGNQDQSLYSSGNSNTFKNIRVLSGNVQLGAADTYQHFFFQPPSTVNGGINLQPGH